MNKMLKGLKEETNYTYTENGAVTHKSSLDAIIDLFGMGAAYRTRSDEDCIVLFKKAFDEDPIYAMKCLFYIRDILEGQGERRFFRVICKWMAAHETEAMRRNLQYIPEFGRWDDLIYPFYGTKLWKDCVTIIHAQLSQDMHTCLHHPSAPISLLGKWLPSENTSSGETRKVANALRASLKMPHKAYRKTLSKLRARINVLECLMSANRWDEIDFSAIPSKAGMRYIKAFMRHDVERQKSGARSYSDFIQDETTTVNARTLYPYEAVEEALKVIDDGISYDWHSDEKVLDSHRIDSTKRAAVNKYWANLHDYFDGCTLDALCVVDTSGSMTGYGASAPINVAISLGLYAAEKARGPFAGHYVSFSSEPQLIETEGVDFVDKVWRIYRTNLCENTDIEATFDMLLETALKNHCGQEDLPKSIIVCSDMEFDSAHGAYSWNQREFRATLSRATLMESIKEKWERAGYKMPNLVFWDVQARQDNIPMRVEDGITMVSGFSPVLFEQVMKGKTAKDFVLDKLNSDRYAQIH